MESEKIEKISQDLIKNVRKIVFQHIGEKGQVTDEEIQNITSALLVEFKNDFGQDASEIRYNLGKILEYLRTITLSEHFWIIRNMRLALSWHLSA